VAEARAAEGLRGCGLGNASQTRNMTDDSNKTGLLPFVRHMLICEHAEAAPNNARRANIYGVFANVMVKGGESAFPCRIGFTVYVMLSDCRRSGNGRIIVTEAASGEACYNGAPFQIVLSSDPLEVYGLFFRITECVIHRAGLYWVVFEFDGVSIGEEPILVKVR
jgi:hypothetical protein